MPQGAYGALPTVAAPFLFDGVRPEPDRSAPGLGEHTKEILREMGLDASK